MSTIAVGDKANAAHGLPSNDRLPLTVIEPRPGWRIVDFVELWRFREVLYYLTLRDITKLLACNAVPR